MIKSIFLPTISIIIIILLIIYLFYKIFVSSLYVEMARPIYDVLEAKKDKYFIGYLDKSCNNQHEYVLCRPYFHYAKRNINRLFYWEPYIDTSTFFAIFPDKPPGLAEIFYIEKGTGKILRSPFTSPRENYGHVFIHKMPTHIIINHDTLKICK